MCYLSLSIYIYLYLYIYLTIYLSVCLSDCLFVYRSYPILSKLIYLSIHPSIYLSIYLYISIHLYLYIYIFTFISIHLHLYIYIFTFISLHLYLSIFLFSYIYIYVCIFTVKHLLIWIHRTLQLLDQVRLDVAAARARSKATLQAGRNRSPCLARHWGMVSYWVYRGFTMGLPGLPDSIQA